MASRSQPTAAMSCRCSEKGVQTVSGYRILGLNLITSSEAGLFKLTTAVS